MPSRLYKPVIVMGREVFRRPPLWLSYSVTFAIVALIGYLRLWVFEPQIFSLGYGMPMLIALWHRSRPQMYFMAVCFTVICYIKIFIMFPAQGSMPGASQINFAMTMVTVWTAAAALHAALYQMARVESHTRKLAETNQELEASNEELAAREEEITRQNSELQSQAEELERQQEELRHQAEELEHQATELHTSNEQLKRRERGLQTLLESARWLRSDLSERDVMAAVCQAAVQVMEHGVVAAAVVQEKDGLLHFRGHHGFGMHGALKRDCPYKNSFAALIIEKKQTGFIADLQRRPDLEVPQPLAGRPFRSVLASPLFVEGEVAGAVEVYALEPREWSEDEFKIIEWLAAQCALALQAIEYQQEVLVKRQEAEDASIQKTRFLAAVSHDVRTPANAISLLADLIEQAARTGDKSADLPELAHDLKSNARSLIDLVSDVLDLARLDTGKLDLQLAEFSLPQLLQAEVRQFERVAAEKNIRIEAETGCESLYLRTDRMKLARILSNLVGNAVKFTEVGAVTLHCDKLPGGAAMITISDTGCGIPETSLSRIFDEFYQIQNPERDRNKGSGLGLAICKRLVDTLGCTLNVESKLGVGTRFTLKLPASLVVPETGAARRHAGGALAMNGDVRGDLPLQGIKVLLVEDHHVTRKAAARLLAGKGATVLQAATGRDAFELLAHEHPQALLLDLMLPDVDGTDVLRFLQSNRPPSLKCILAVSGDVREARVVEVKSLGADDLIPKPLDVQKLLDAIAQRLGGGGTTAASVANS